MACEPGRSTAPSPALTCSTVRVSHAPAARNRWLCCRALWWSGCLCLHLAAGWARLGSNSTSDALSSLHCCRCGLPRGHEAHLRDGQVLADAVRGQRQADEAQPRARQAPRSQAAVHHVASAVWWSAGPAWESCSVGRAAGGPSPVSLHSCTRQRCSAQSNARASTHERMVGGHFSHIMLATALAIEWP